MANKIKNTNMTKDALTNTLFNLLQGEVWSEMWNVKHAAIRNNPKTTFPVMIVDVGLSNDWNVPLICVHQRRWPILNVIHCYNKQKTKFC